MPHILPQANILPQKSPRARITMVNKENMYLPSYCKLLSAISNRNNQLYSNNQSNCNIQICRHYYRLLQTSH